MTALATVPLVVLQMPSVALMPSVMPQAPSMMLGAPPAVLRMHLVVLQAPPHQRRCFQQCLSKSPL